MDMIGSEAIIEGRNLAVLQVLPQTGATGIAVARELQQKRAVMAAAGNVEDSVRTPEPIRARHGCMEEARFRKTGRLQPKTVAKKPSKGRFSMRHSAKKLNATLGTLILEKSVRQ